jgi:hypothetical protein
MTCAFPKRPSVSGCWRTGRGLTASAAESRAYQPRYRRVGELIQLDGCDHWWFENRGRTCTLLVFIYDATSRLMQLRFVRTESTFAYFEILRGYLEAHGRPVAFYTDKHSVFRVNKREAMKGDGLTQFGRALHSLNIELICANSSQAKGRVERAHKTLQDRLVKELRLAGVSDIDSANAFLPRFMSNHNARFAKPPANPKDLHRALTGRDDPDEAFTWRTTRTVIQSLTVQYDRVVYVLEQTPEALAAVGKLAEVVEYPDGRIVVRQRRALALSSVRQGASRLASRDRREQVLWTAPGTHPRGADPPRRDLQTQKVHPAGGRLTIALKKLMARIRRSGAALADGYAPARRVRPHRQ